MKFLLRSQSMGMAAILLGTSVFLSRIFGLVRDKIISYYFGASPETDIYFTSFVLPDFLNYLLAGGYFSITLVPLLAAAFLRSEQDGWRFFSSAVCWAALGILSLTATAWVFAPELAQIIAPGFTPENNARLGSFLRIILPAQVFFLPGACFSALLYYRRQFTAPALSPLIYNACIIAGGLLSFYLFPTRGMEGFCWGVLAGAFFGSLALPVLAARQGGLVFMPRLKHPDMKKLLLLALPLMLGQSIVTLDEQFVRIFGSLAEEGSVSLLSYARRIMLVPVGVVAQAAGLASFPFLASLAANGKNQEFNSTLNLATTNTLLIALPLSIYMSASAEDIMRLIFQQGSFNATDATESGLLLSVMMLSVGLWSVQQILGRAFYACQNTLTPALAGTLATVIALPLYWLGAKHHGALGVALAGTAGVALYTIFITCAWVKGHGTSALQGLLSKTFYSLTFCLPAAIVAHFASQGVYAMLPKDTLLGAFTSLCASSLSFAVIYLGSARLFKPEISAPVLGFAAKALRRWKK